MQAGLRRTARNLRQGSSIGKEHGARHSCPFPWDSTPSSGVVLTPRMSISGNRFGRSGVTNNLESPPVSRNTSVTPSRRTIYGPEPLTPVANKQLQLLDGHTALDSVRNSAGNNFKLPARSRARAL